MLMLVVWPSPGRPAGAGETVDVSLLGFLAGLPTTGLELPPATATMARLEVPDEQGGRRLSLPVELSARMDLVRRSDTVRNGQIVEVEGTLVNGSIVIRRLQEPERIEMTGWLSLQEPVLHLPVPGDRLLTVVLGKGVSLPFLFTPQTESMAPSLRDGDPVVLTVVAGRRLVVGVQSGKQ